MHDMNTPETRALNKRNYVAFQYLLKKRPREYRGVWFEENYFGYHLYQQFLPGTQIGRYRLMFQAMRGDIQNEQTIEEVSTRFTGSEE
jgi:hypothetical protein